MNHSTRLPGAVLAAAALAAGLAGCGHRGDPLPPLRRTPPGLAEFRFAQRGDALEVSLLAPGASVDGIAYERLTVEILYAEGDKDLEKAGTRRETLAYANQRVVETLPLPPPGTIARAAARGVVGGDRGPRTLTLGLVAQAVVALPGELRARLVAGGVELAWTGAVPAPVDAAVKPPAVRIPFQTPDARPDARPPGTPGAPGVPQGAAPAPGAAVPGVAPAEAVRSTEPPPRVAPAPSSPAAQPAPGPPTAGAPPGVKVTTVELRKSGYFAYRRIGTEPYRLPLGQQPLAEPRVTDVGAPQGATACYVVRAVASVDPLVESAASNEACVGVRDIQPPAAPTGLAVLPRERGLEVLWTPSPEPDLASYRVYREAPGEPRQRLAEVPAARAAWLDETAKAGVVYQYTVSAVDAAGNEGPPTPAADGSL